MLFAVLVALVILGIGLGAAATRWSYVLQREREAELVFRGEAIVRALEAFQADRPGALPRALEELVEGRYLRRAWTDPMARRPFLLVLEEMATGDEPPGILGVRSASDRLSLRPYEGARRYADWRFVVERAATEAGPDTRPDAAPEP